MLVAVIAGLAACGAPPTATRPAGAGAGAAAPARTAAVSSQDPALPDAVPWRADQREVRGEVKEPAARVVEIAGSWSTPGGGGAEAMATRLAAAGYPSALGRELAALQAPDVPDAVTEVINPQYGGLTASDASVIIRVLQTLAEPAGMRSRELILDLRMGLGADGSWTVTAVGAARSLGPPVAVSTLGQSVLANPRLLIPEPGRADIGTGRIHERVLSILDELSGRYRVEVQVITAGHHGLVWGTPRTSNHAVGRAVDIWRIDGRPVLGADPAVVREVMVAAARAGATEVGGPVAVEGMGFFTDDVHSDHIHIGVNPAKPPAAPGPPR